MTTLSTIGLVMTVFCWFAVGVVLIADAARKWIFQLPTYSELIWAKLDRWRAGVGPFPIMAVLLPGFFLFGTIGLAMHFFF